MSDAVVGSAPGVDMLLSVPENDGEAQLSVILLG